MMDSRITEEVSITDLFDQFIEASTMRNVLSIHRRILNYADLNSCEYNTFFPKLKKAVLTTKARKNWKAKALFSKIDKKASHRCYSNTKTSTATPQGTKTTGDNSGNSRDGLDDSISSQSNRAHYGNNALQNYNCLIIGSGPAGLRTAIELQLLGANRVVVVEKRSRFSRNNVLHLWPFVIDDLKSLGAKKFYGKFCAGSIDHIAIRQLQLILLKICLMIGCEFRDSCSYLYLCPSSLKQTARIGTKMNGDSIIVVNEAEDLSGSSTNLKCDIESVQVTNEFVKVSDTIKIADDQHASISQTNSIQVISHEEVPRSRNLRGVRAHFQSDSKIQDRELHDTEWDIIIGADGRRNTLSKFFPRKEFRGRLAIAITANFINRQTPAEASVAEISGLSFIYNQDMFNALAYDTNIQLENICYYKDDTHYFVMTAKKKSLLEKGVLKSDYATTQDLLSDDNVDREALLNYAKDAAFWTTGLEPLDFALNHYGQEDCAMFDFTSMYAASNACKALRTSGGGLSLVGLVGDSLLEPFWPTGSGCARGFLSAFDAAWMCRQWAINKCATLDSHNSMSSRQGRNRSSAASDCDKATNIEPTTYNRMALSVMAERESIYRILAQTTSENLQQNYSHWTLNPHSRYPNLNRHLVAPSQVEHLMSDNDDANKRYSPVARNRGKLAVPSGADRGRRVKSPNNQLNSRKSPKKLKSADASPLAQPKNPKIRSKSLTKYARLGQREFELDDTYLKFEESYKDLADTPNGGRQYLNYGRPNCDLLDDLFIPSISGTLPSSNNLHSLEARRARDIDECLRQRRQKTKINVVRDQLIEQFRNNAPNRDSVSASRDVSDGVGGRAAIFHELRRLREQQARNKENKPKDINGPLSLLNSMRRCASFAERVKSFESKLGSSTEQNTSTATTPKTPIDNVKNLPQFATLQELFVNNSATAGNNEASVKKSKIPITKLSKDDWNVKCWENRLAAYRERQNARNFTGSTKSLNKAISVDSYHSHHAQNSYVKPKKQVEVFQDRIKEMADKLKTAKDRKLYGDANEDATNSENGKQREVTSSSLKFNGRPQGGWVSHLKKELINGSGTKRQPSSNRQPMNPNLPSKPIKKLFEDDEDDGQHFDHLCLNRPTNRSLTNKNGYTSHLVRTKYNSATSKVINTKPSIASKQAYVASLTSRGSSASSTLSDYSTNTGHSSTNSMRQNNLAESSIIKCYRCDKRVTVADKITIGQASLHRNCLTCAQCGITLRTNEIQHYLELTRDSSAEERSSNQCFVCVICKPEIRADLTSSRSDNKDENDSTHGNAQKVDYVQSKLKSREEFLSARINYNELYRNLLDNENANINEVKEKIGRLNSSSSRETTPGISIMSSSTCYEDARSKLETDCGDQLNLVSPSPTRVTLPLQLVIDSDSEAKPVAGYNDAHDEAAASSEDEQVGKQPGGSSKGYKIARSETVDGSEQVTLMLPDDSMSTTLNERASFTSKPREMIDEEEFERVLNSGNSKLDLHKRKENINDEEDKLAANKQQSSSNACELSSKSSPHPASDPSKSQDGTATTASSEDTSDENVEDEEDEESRAACNNAEITAASDVSSSLNSPPNTDEYDDEDDDDDEESNDHVDSTYGDFATSEEFDSSTSDREDVEEDGNSDQVGHSSGVVGGQAALSANNDSTTATSNSASVQS